MIVTDQQFGRKIDLTGRRFGRLVAFSYAEASKSGNAKWRCHCDCGAISTVVGVKLRKGNALSCGCSKGELISAAKIRHGHGTRAERSSTYRSWRSMRTRCENPNDETFQAYGAVGITVCDRWLVFDNFLEDMGERPPGTSIDRIDNAKGYEPGNCRWASRSVQSLNRNKMEGCTSVYKGVSRHSQTGKWCAQGPRIGGVHAGVGYFETEHEAAVAVRKHLERIDGCIGWNIDDYPAAVRRAS